MWNWGGQGSGRASIKFQSLMSFICDWVAGTKKLCKSPVPTSTLRKVRATQIQIKKTG